MKFNLELFEQLNEEYRHQPLVRRPRKFLPSNLELEASKRLKDLEPKFNIHGKRVLEIGCGRGHAVAEFARSYGCRATGIDIKEYAEWDRLNSPSIRFIKSDISTVDISIGPFDIIVSFVVLEHVKHPFSALKNAFDLLAPGGSMYLTANLYRGPKASHRYRQVFFPWPHLLFSNQVFKEFYQKHHKKIADRVFEPAWLNKLVAAQYLLYFNLIGFETVEVSYAMTAIDQPFYNRFEKILSSYPIFDLERDFIKAHIRKPFSCGGEKTKRYYNIHEASLQVEERSRREVFNLFHEHQKEKCPIWWHDIPESFRNRCGYAELQKWQLSDQVNQLRNLYIERFDADSVNKLIPRLNLVRADICFHMVPSNFSLLDIGSGHGEFVNLFARNSLSNVSSVDIKDYKLWFDTTGRTKRIYKSLFELSATDAHDIVTCFEVIEHLPPARLKEAISILKKLAKKKLFLSVPFMEPLPLYKGHFTRFDAALLEQLFPEARFTVFDKGEKNRPLAWIMCEIDLK